MASPTPSHLDDVSLDGETLIEEASTESNPQVFAIKRIDKCPLLWTLKGTDQCILWLKGRQDVALFPHIVAKYHVQDAIILADAVQFVQLEAQPSKLQTHPTATLKEIDDIFSRAAALKQTREILVKRIRACGPTVFAEFKANTLAKHHKFALGYIFEYLKTISKARARSIERLSTRQTQFKAWYAFMVGKESKNQTPAPTSKSQNFPSPLPPKNIKVEVPAKKEPATQERPTSKTHNFPSPLPPKNIKVEVTAKKEPTTQERPPTPPKKSEIAPPQKLKVDIEAKPAIIPEGPVVDLATSPSLVKRNPAKARIIHWHVEKLVRACKESNPDMPDARDVAEFMKEALDYLMPLDTFTANQMNQTILKIEKDLGHRDAADIRRLVAPLALSKYLKPFFPPPINRTPKLPSLNKRGCRVHFANMLHHVKEFYTDDAPQVIQTTAVQLNNDNIREGTSLSKRPSSAIHVYEPRPAKFHCLG